MTLNTLTGTDRPGCDECSEPGIFYEMLRLARSLCLLCAKEEIKNTLSERALVTHTVEKTPPTIRRLSLTRSDSHRRRTAP